MFKVVPFPVDQEYKKHDNINSNDIQNLREWIKTQPHLPQDDITDLDIILAYHSCGFNSDLTKNSIDLNYTLRTMFSFYQNRRIDKTVERALDCWLVTPLTTLTNNGYLPIYCQLLDPNPSQFVYGDVVKLFVMIIDLCLYENGTVPGIAILLNMEKVSLGHVSRVDLTVAQQFFYFLQETMFVRLKEFHFINAPSFMEKLMSMFKPFMKEQMLQLVYSHSVGSDTLNDFLPAPALPKDAGGDNSASALLKDNIWSKLKANEAFFTEESKKIVDESLRPGGPKTMSTFFPGLEGSFKRLGID